MLTKISYAHQSRESGSVIRNTILWVLLCVCSGASAWGQADCNSRQVSCSPGQYVDLSGPQYACRPCTGNTYSDGCTASCRTSCPQGTVASAGHQCLPTCQATVTGPQLKADSGGSGPLHVVSFSGNVTNPPSINGKDWYTPDTTSLKTLSTQSTCEDYWTWKAESTTGTWKDQAAQCKYTLESSGQTGPPHHPVCQSGYKGHFTIGCAGNSCKF
jgi:hypothetical protein